MKVINSLREGNDYKRICLALGNFDGVHLGHQQLIKAIINKSKEYNGIPAVLTFSPHPATVINPSAAPKKIITEQRKLIILTSLGVQLVIQLPFTQEFARLNPNQFIDELNKQLDLFHIVVGFNYTFGRGGKGNWKLLKQLAPELDYSLEIIPPIKIENTVISSTTIREALLQGNINNARKFLGWAPVLEGIVVSGNQLGRTLGFPTANLKAQEDVLMPKNGVYLVLAKIEHKEFFGVLNIGKRPTLTTTEHPIPEVYIFNFNENIYGKKLEVHLLEHIRDEIKFKSKDDLVRQIAIDCEAANNMINMKYNENRNIPSLG
ncbi:MAG: bifunctional riboflavin kinase/FAD synthetase [Bacillota bacterium]|nr:bifunctional riboflavin kinase/FAD synthetase [Bacillota bacterium]